MSQKKLQKGLEWLNKEVKKDEVDLSKERERFIQEIKNIKREELFPTMDKITKGYGILEELARLADSVQNLYNGKTTFVFELEEKEYKSMLEFFKDVEQDSKTFKIDISGCDFIYILTSPSDES
jgi:ABC-type molybdate transport system ATPase subunit